MHLHHGAAPRFEGSETSCPLKFDKTLSSEFLPHNNIGCGNSETVIYNWITSANLVNAIASSRCTHAANVFTLPEKSPTGASFSEFPPLWLRDLKGKTIRFHKGIACIRKGMSKDDRYEPWCSLSTVPTIQFVELMSSPALAQRNNLQIFFRTSRVWTLNENSTSSMILEKVGPLNY